MRRLLAVTFPLLLTAALLASSARAEESTCGRDLHQDIAAAEQASTHDDPASQAFALRCAIAALKRIDEQNPIVKRDAAPNSLLRVPPLHGGKPLSQ